MPNYYGPKIATDGLQLYLDAANVKSYPGTGATWYDLSGNGKNFTLNGATWNSAGYILFDGVNDNATGPASNTFNLGSEHTVETVSQLSVLKATTLFNWVNANGDRQIMAHVPWENGAVFYDVAGCCGADNRIFYTPSTSFLNRTVHMTFRTRTSTTPRRQVFENSVEKVNSGANVTANISFGNTPAVLGDYSSTPGTAYNGRLYMIRLYNRALTDGEVLENYNATKTRFEL